MKERTFVMVKPDGVRRNLIGEIIRKIESSSLRIAAMKMIKVDKKLAEQHYAEHREKPFYKDLVDYVTSHHVVPMVVEGEDAIRRMRELMGKTDPAQSDKGTIRGDFGLSILENVVHGSDSPEKAEREIGLFFGEDDIYG